jgi:acyl-CoA thioesterase I
MKFCLQFFLIGLLFVVSGCMTTSHDATHLERQVNSGNQQRIVVYGTSLTALPWSTWAQDMQTAYDAQYPGLVQVINSGSGGKWSGWGVENLDRRVIAKNPDMVIIEFGINDAYLEYETSVELAHANLENMIDRILAAHPKCEIILMTMNPPVDIHLSRRPNIDAYYQMYRDTAKARNLPLIDLHSAWMKILSEDRALFDRYVPDGIHPGPEGCATVIAPAILDVLGVRGE